MSFLPGLKKLGLDSFGGRKFLLVLLCLAAVAWCTVHAVKVDKDQLDWLKWLIGMYFTANVSAGGVQWLTSKLQGMVAAAPTNSAADNQALIAALNDALTKLKTSTPVTPAAGA